MKRIVWEKQGLVLDPTGAPAWRRGHSGMVSVLPWTDEGYRVFLTGRDEAGRFQIGWVDLDASLKIRRENAANPLLCAGAAGSFDDRGLCMPTVVRVSENELYMYYAGWGPSAPGQFANQCGLAVSRDNGRSWQRHEQAPLALCDEQDPIGTGTVFALRDQPDRWRLWYTTFRNWEPLPDGGWRHYYHIKYAESTDGVNWRKPPDNMAIDFIGQEYAVGRPMVFREADGYRMWFCTRSIGSTYRIGYAESPDGRRWTRADAGIEPSASGWDAEMIEYAYVVKRGEEYLMFYNGNGFGASGTGVAVGVCR